MQINLTGHHLEVTPPLRDYVTNKMERLERHFDHVTDIHVILSVEKLRHRAEATLRLSGGNVFADATQEDMYAALDSWYFRVKTRGSSSCLHCGDDLSFFPCVS